MPDIDLSNEEVKAAIAEAAKEQAATIAEEIAAAKVAEETEGLKNKNAQLLGEVKKFKAKASSIPDDFDPEAWSTMREEAEKAREEAAKQAGKWDEYKAELVEQHKQREKELLDQTGNLKGQLENVLINNEIMSAIGKAKGNAELLMPHVRKHVSLVDDGDGKQVARVLDANGNARIIGSNGDYMTIEQLLSEFKESTTYAPCFEGSRATGSGANGGKNNGASGANDNPFAKDTRNLTEQARILRENPDEAARLKAAAGV